MSRISRRHIQNNKNLSASIESSNAVKGAMKEKYAKNVKMMKQLQKESEKLGDFCESEDESDGGESESTCASSRSGGNQAHDEDPDKEDGSVRDSQRSWSHEAVSGKVVKQEYIKACLASAAEEKRKNIDSAGEGSDWLDGPEFETAQSGAKAEDFAMRYRRESLHSFQGVEDATDRSLASTEDSDDDRSFFKALYSQLAILLEKYENVNRAVAIVSFYAIGVAFYSHSEDWSFSDTVYFITVSITTVGFGDMVPSTDSSKAFTMMYVLLGLVVIFSYVNHFAESMLQYAETQAEKVAEKHRKRCRDRKEDTSGADGVHYAKYRKKLVFYIVLVVVVIFIGAFFYMYNENWSFMNALYFSFIATLTIGYGDPVLQNPSSRTFSIFYVLFSVVIIAMALGNIGAIKLTIRQDRKKFEMLHRKLDLSSIIAMDDDGDGVDRVEFLTAMLMQMNGLSKEDDIDPWLKRFEELDKDGSGLLDQEDLRLFAEEEEIRKQVRRDVRNELEKNQGVSGLMRRVLMNDEGSLMNLFGSVGDSDSDSDSDSAAECEKGKVDEERGMMDERSVAKLAPSAEESRV